MMEIVKVKCRFYNHGLPDKYEGHPLVGHLTADEKKHVADLTKHHVALRQMLFFIELN
jgi:hypothetical protein